MFEQAAHLLLGGHFICETTAGECFRYLQHEPHRAEIDAWLRRMGRRLACTSTGYAYYMAYEKIGPGERTEVRKMFSDFKHNLRPVVNFMKLTMQALRREQAPTPGERIDFAATLNAIMGNAQLADELKGFPSLGKEYAAGDASVRSILDRVFQQLTKGGYLHLLDREREVYAFTGKIDYLDEVIQFLMANEQITEEEEPEPEQKELL